MSRRRTAEERRKKSTTLMKKWENRKKSAAVEQKEFDEVYALREVDIPEWYLLKAQKVVSQRPTDVQETLPSPSDIEGELSDIDTDELFELTRGRYEEYEGTNPESAKKTQVAAALESTGNQDVPTWMTDSSEEDTINTEISSQEANDVLQVAGYQTSPEPSIDSSTTELEMSSSDEPPEERGDNDYEDNEYVRERTMDLTDIRLTRATSNLEILEGNENVEAEVQEPSKVSKKNSAYLNLEKTLEHVVEQFTPVEEVAQETRATDEDHEMKAQQTLKMRNQISDLLFQAQEMFMQSQRVADGFVEYAKFIGDGNGEYDARKHFDGVLKRDIYDIGAVE